MLLYRFFISFLFIIAFQSYVFAQEMKKDTIPKTKEDSISLHSNIFEPKVQKDNTIETKGEKKQEGRKYNATQFLHESFLFVKQPVSWKGNDWLTVGAVTALTISIMPFDERITNSTQGEQRYFNSFPIEGGRIYGEWYSIGGLAALFGCYGMITRDSSAKKITIELLQAGIYSEAATWVLKVAIGRARPNDKNAFAYKPFTSFIDDNFHSLPSGHTTSAFALSTVMSRHANSTILKILAYVPAGFTMFSRIYQYKHWLSDEIPAAAIGYFVGNWVVDLHEGKRHRINVTSVYPVTISINLDRETAHK